MLIRKSLYALLLATLVSLLLVSPALAFPPLPSSIYGKVKLDGSNVPDGTLVRALVGGQAYAETRTLTYQGDSVFSLDVPGDDTSTADIIEGGKEGDTIQFEVGGLKADQSGTWQGGKNVNLDLTVKATAPLQTPAPSPTPVPTQTPIATVVQPTQTPPPPPTPTQTLAPTVAASATAEGTQVAALPGDSGSASTDASEQSLAAPLVANNASGQTGENAASPAPTTVDAAAAPANTAPAASSASASGSGLAWLAVGVVVLLLGGGAWLWFRRPRRQ